MKYLTLTVCSCLIFVLSIFSSNAQSSSVACVLPSPGIYQRTNTANSFREPMYYLLSASPSGAIGLQNVSQKPDGTFQLDIYSIPGLLSDPQVHGGKCVVSITEGGGGGNKLESLSTADAQGSFILTLVDQNDVTVLTDLWIYQPSAIAPIAK